MLEAATVIEDVMLNFDCPANPPTRTGRLGGLMVSAGTTAGRGGLADLSTCIPEPNFGSRIDGTSLMEGFLLSFLRSNRSVRES